jgi:hypothetical protein
VEICFATLKEYLANRLMPEILRAEDPITKNNAKPKTIYIYMEELILTGRKSRIDSDIASPGVSRYFNSGYTKTRDNNSNILISRMIIASRYVRFCEYL